jgi:hypothetical protein
MGGLGPKGPCKYQTLSQGLCPKSYAHRALAPRPPSPLGLP